MTSSLKRARPFSNDVVVTIVLVSFVLVTAAFGNNPVPTVVVPTIPQAVVPGSGAFTLKVYGANFVSGAVVNWNGQARTTTFVSARELQAQILASDIVKPTAGYITVTNPPPGGGVSSASYAIVEVHEPTKTISVKQPTTYPNNPGYVITADFTGDGILDLVTGSDDAYGPVSLNVGNGDGTFQSAITIGSDYFPLAGMGFGDFNGEGKLDIAYGWQDSKSGFCAFGGNPPCYVEVLVNKGHEKFHGLHPFGSYGETVAASIVAGDFNNDGMLDLAVFEGDEVGEIFLGNGDGTFTHKQTIHFGQVNGFGAVTADFNGDGELDLVAAYGNSLYLMLGNGDGTFQKPRRIVSDRHQIDCGLVVNDFNGDGIPDLAFCDEHLSGGASAARLGILLGNGDGTFRGPVYYWPGAPYGGSFAAGDFNSDGKTDLIFSGAILSHGYKPVFCVLWGNGDGTFQKPKKIALPDDSSGSFVPGDFNSDGLLDFVMVVSYGLAAYIQQ
jgi:hypothetical protein